MDNSEIVGDQISKLMKNGKTEEGPGGETKLYPELDTKNQSSSKILPKKKKSSSDDLSVNNFE
jgi:hypothetical protein